MCTDTIKPQKRLNQKCGQGRDSLVKNHAIRPAESEIAYSVHLSASGENIKNVSKYLYARSVVKLLLLLC